MKHIAGNMRSRWEAAWAPMLQTIGALGADDLLAEVMIRDEAHSVMQAINRQVTHYAYHVGQIVHAARGLSGDSWTTLSIPRGQSETFDVSKDGTPYLADTDGSTES
jgi:hypothetical protein